MSHHPPAPSVKEAASHCSTPTRDNVGRQRLARIAHDNRDETTPPKSGQASAEDPHDSRQVDDNDAVSTDLRPDTSYHRDKRSRA